VNLEAELEAAQKKPGSKCSVCVWIEGLPPEDQKQWDAALAKPVSKFSHVSVYELAKKYGAPIGRTSIAHHRNTGHRA
jgi:ribosomal protein S25